MSSNSRVWLENISMLPAVAIVLLARLISGLRASGSSELAVSLLTVVGICTT